MSERGASPSGKDMHAATGLRAAGLLSVGLSVAAGLVGCGEYCEYDETKCDDDGILRCYQSDGFADHTFTLEEGCAIGERCLDRILDPETGLLEDPGAAGGEHEQGRRTAVCSLTGEETDPRCPDSRLAKICIDDTSFVTCWFGYSSNLGACDVACIEPGGFCAIETEPSSACDAITADGSGTGCDVTSNAILSCRSRYVTDRIACASDQQCVEASTPFHRNYCASEDPCAGSNTFCTGNRIEGCVDGRTVAMTCSEGTQCEEFGVLGPDNRPTGATEAQCLRR
jgi:hypothetical protein